MRISSPSDLLQFWEKCHGKLETEELRELFVRHECVEEILNQQQERIVVAIRRNIKLRDILEDLYMQDDRHTEFLDKYYPFRNSKPEELRSQIEQRERFWTLGWTLLII